MTAGVLSTRQNEACDAVIRLAEEHGPVLTGRTVGNEVRERIEKCVARGETVVVDFEGVLAVSPSFADEVFARVSAEAVDSGLVRFENLADDLLEIARLVSRRRGLGDAA
jgi:hypothetical protein